MAFVIVFKMNDRPLQIGLMIAVSLHAFDELVLTIALPTIIKDLGGEGWYGVTLAAYILATLISVVWAGASIDKRGPVRIFFIGVILFAAGLLMGMQATTVYEFIIARVLQGLGGGINWTIAFAVTNIVFPKSRQPRMIAWLDSAWLIPSLVAPIVGGYIVDHLDWHWIFLGQLPFLLITVILVYPPLKPLTKSPAATHTAIEQSIFGAIRIAIGAGLLVTVLARPVDWSWLLGIPASLIIAWRPLIAVMPKGFMLLRPGLAAAVMLHFLMFYAFYTAEMFMPRLMIEVRGISTSVTGLAFTCCATAWVAASFLQAWLSSRLSVYSSMMIGIVITTLGLGITGLLLIPAMPYWLVYIGWAVAGIGMGIGFNTVVAATMAYTETGKEGATSTANGIAASLGIGLAAGFGGAINNHGEFIGIGLGDSLVFVWCISGLACVACLWIIQARFKQAPPYLHGED